MTQLPYRKRSVKSVGGADDSLTRSCHASHEELRVTAKLSNEHILPGSPLSSHPTKRDISALTTRRTAKIATYLFLFPAVSSFVLKVPSAFSYCTCMVISTTQITPLDSQSPSTPIPLLLPLSLPAPPVAPFSRPCTLCTCPGGSRLPSRGWCW